MLRALKSLPTRIANRIFPREKKLLLEMLWPEELLVTSDLKPLSENYLLRQYNPADSGNYSKLLQKSKMGECPMDYWEKYILPGGFFVVEHIASKDIVGACFASHQSRERHHFAGNLGWLAVDPDHRGNKIGVLLVNSVVNRLQRAGYERIYLETHDFRLPALKIYIDAGWVPFFYADEMIPRWKAIYSKLGKEFKPDAVPAISANE